MALRRLVAACGLVAVVVVSSATATQADANARVQITGSGTSYRATWINDGDRPILCAGLLLTGVQPIAATGPPGVLTRVGTFQGQGLVHMQGTASVPVVAPGGTVTVDFQTNVPIPANAGGEIRYSETCLPGSDKFDRATGPTPPPPPKPQPEPKRCQCTDLRTRIVPNRLLSPQDVAGGMQIEVLVEWTLTCTKGTGRCQGELTLGPSARGKRLGASVSAPAGGKVTCDRPCATKTSRFQKFLVKAGSRYVQGKRGKSASLLRLEMKRVCTSVRLKQAFDIVFTKNGAVDFKRSDLNANGIADGKDWKG